MTPYNSRIGCFVGYFPHSQNQLYSSPLQICIVGHMYYSKKKTQNDNVKLEQKTRRRKNLSLNRVFHKLDNNKGKMHTGARAKEQKYISIYISLCMKTFLKTGVYIYIYILITNEDRKRFPFNPPSFRSHSVTFFRVTN